jgi:hypothetical protein
MRSRIGGGVSGLPPLMVSLAALTVACSERDAPTAPPSAPLPSTMLQATELQAASGRGVDAEFTRLARAIPGFAGMFYDDAGRLNVYLKEPQAGAARTTNVVGSLRAHSGAAVKRRLDQSRTVVIHAAKYDYLELQAYRARLKNIFNVRGVVYTDTDERLNRVRIALLPGVAEAEVVRELGRAGVPRDGVVISRSSPIERLKTVQDRFRPVPGAAQIVFPAPSEDPGALFVCSIGFNARIPSRPDLEFFVTASHCSDVQGGNQSTPYYQPFPGEGSAANRIAREFKDPAYGNPGGLCVYEGARCRLSDALLARYTNEDFSQFGKIARTTFGLRRIGSLEVDSDNPRWHVVGELGFPFEGEIVHKVGRTSGWTHGPVILSCVDVGVSGTDIVQICQDFVLAGGRAGDSGAGVFQRDGGNRVLLNGILWGGGTLDGAPVFIFSAMENIEHELGPLTTASTALASAQ